MDKDRNIQQRLFVQQGDSHAVWRNRGEDVMEDNVKICGQLHNFCRIEFVVTIVERIFQLENQHFTEYVNRMCWLHLVWKKQGN